MTRPLYVKLYVVLTDEDWLPHASSDDYTVDTVHISAGMEEHNCPCNSCSVQHSTDSAASFQEVAPGSYLLAFNEEPHVRHNSPRRGIAADARAMNYKMDESGGTGDVEHLPGGRRLERLVRFFQRRTEPLDARS